MTEHSGPAPTPGVRTAARGRTGPSQADVARIAGVSGQTVSRVANGAENVLPETRSRVLEVMAQLGYSPNTAARALRYGAFQTIGVIAHKLARTGESRTTEAVVEAARAAGHTVTLVDVSSPSSRDVAAAASQLTNQAIDGLVIIRAELESPESLTLPRDLPVVVSDSQFEGHLPTVGADQEGGTRAAVEHLLGLGHTTVHLLAGPASSIPAALRERSWRRTLEQHGRAIATPYPGDWTPAAGYAAGHRIADDRAVTAVLCANDEMAAGVLLALHQRGLRVPEDVSVVGFDNVPLAEYFWPPLTTVNQDFAAIGHELVASLLARMRSTEESEPQRTIIPAELVIRSSTGAPGAR
ncbi:LacI family DNA-binding transcriptional regulator [Demequina muriae]|uniref:LacI family DNA-binding transcriptional regulator n=1 Tax=Demequina muriae TaxID=3051664 RepID=A0ABT8GFU1_9MICO|nr:LacI family DNA-binding transcriptional regulator [Demequina sp. EGI L300058]MDN4480311.1 LacI family DNA-binding transcriptional regulator [Demequina sp. EGI L300058]